MKLALYYDGDCPFCSKYADILRLQSCYELKIYNAREESSWQTCKKNIKLDDGVIFIVNGSCFQGVEALDMLLKTCKYKGLFFGFHKLIFSNSFIGNGVYWVFKILRKIALALKYKA